MTTKPELPSRPLVYVASLSDFNNGDIVGAWLFADVPTEVLQAAIDRILQRSAFQLAEEWIILDSRGFNADPPTIYESLGSIVALATAHL